MTNHIHLKIDKATTAADIDKFLFDASKKSLGALHLRAYETTYTPLGGQPCTVRILYLRSGRENPLEWLRNTFHRKSQYVLAANVLREQGNFNVDALHTHPQLKSTCPRLKAAPKLVKSGDDERGILLSSLLPNAVPFPAIPQPALATLGPDGFVKNQQVDHVDCLGRDMGSHGTQNSPSSYRASLESMTELSSAPISTNNFAEFLKVTDCDPEELQENFESFTRLAVELYDTALPESKFVEHIKKETALASLLLGAAQFTLHWAKCWDLNTDLHNEMPYSQIAMIDRFVTWIAKNYLSQPLGRDLVDRGRVDCDALEALAQWSPPAGELVDVRVLTVLAALKRTT